MKRKFYNVLWVMLGLILVMGAVGLGGCSKDDDEDELGGDVYIGYIEAANTEHNSILIKVTRSPYEVDGVNENGEPMPTKNELLYATEATSTNFDLNKGKKLLFRIKTQKIAIFLPDGTNPYKKDPFDWTCEIEILKVY